MCQEEGGRGGGWKVEGKGKEGIKRDRKKSENNDGRKERREETKGKKGWTGKEERKGERYGGERDQLTGPPGVRATPNTCCASIHQPVRGGGVTGKV